jgi:hypothetical protein
MEYIDVTPTWEQIMPTMLFAYLNTSPTARNDLKQEFMNCARLATHYNEMAKESRGKEVSPKINEGMTRGNLEVVFKELSDMYYNSGNSPVMVVEKFMINLREVIDSIPVE